MNGMIFAAGLGTRLAPLTDDRPKALVNINGTPLLELAIKRFIECGIANIVVNVHHKAAMVVEYIDAHRAEWDCDIAISDETDQLLDTGGGLCKALPLFGNDGPIVVGNADVVSNIPLEEVYTEHKRMDNDVTLVTSGRHSSRNLLFDIDGRLGGWVNKKTGEKKIARQVELPLSEAFNGFHVINQEVVRAMMPVRPQPIIGAYLELCDRFAIRRSHMTLDRYWFDVGTPQKLTEAELFLTNNEICGYGK